MTSPSSNKTDSVAGIPDIKSDDAQERQHHPSEASSPAVVGRRILGRFLGSPTTSNAVSVEDGEKNSKRAARAAAPKTTAPKKKAAPKKSMDKTPKKKGRPKVSGSPIFVSRVGFFYLADVVHRGPLDFGHNAQLQADGKKLVDSRLAEISGLGAIIEHSVCDVKIQGLLKTE